MKEFVDQIFLSLGVRTVLIDVVNNKESVASATGVYLNLPVFSINAIIGRVFVNEEYFNTHLTDDEQKFILAHEATHIYRNHVISTILSRIPKAILKTYATHLSLALDTLKMFLHIFFGIPSPESALTRQQEIEADVWAICLTGNKTAAINCLAKLVKGDLTRPSHTWEALGMKLPAMTMQERINEIQNQIRQLEACGYIFR